MNEAQLSQLLDHLYEGIVAPSGWQSTLAALAEATGSEAASLVLWNRDTDQAMVGEQIGLPEQLVADYGRHFHQLDPGRRFMDAVPTGQWYLDERDFGAAAIRRAAFYQDFLRKYELDSTMASPFLRSGGLEGFLSLGAAAGRRDLTATARALQRVMPHFARAAALRVRLQTATQQAEMGQRMLDQFDFGVLAVTASRRVLLANRLGEKWLADPACPLTGNSPDADTMRELLRSACGAGRPRRAKSMRLRGTPEGLSRYVTAVPLPAAMQGTWVASEPAALVMLTDPDRAQPDAHALLAQLFGLTPAELRLLAPLLRGQALKEACFELRISYDTGRSHLKSIFGKTGVRRQIDLARLVAHLDIVRIDAPTV